jgi:hypothetical protein
MAGNSILDRFRPIGAPGRGLSGVPHDEVGAERELEPVFAALQADVDAARRRVEEASRAAAATREEAGRRSGELLAQARAAVAGVRAAAVLRVERDAAERERQVNADAQRRADELVSAAEPKLAVAAHELIDAMVDELLGGPQ